MPLGIFAGDASAVLGKVTKPVLSLSVLLGRLFFFFLALSVVLSVVPHVSTSSSFSWSLLLVLAAVAVSSF